MKTIAYYVTDSGFGHITRSTAIVRNILEYSKYNVLIVCNKEQNSHAKIDLMQYEKRVSFTNVMTDASSAFYENSLKVNTEATEANVKSYLSELEDHMDLQYDLLKGMEIVGVVTDISILGIMVGKKLGVPVVGISNYTWYNRFKSMGVNDDLINIYKKWYDRLDILLKFNFSDDMSGIECPMKDVGLVCREVNEMSSGDFKKLYWPAVYLSVGQVEKKKEKFEINFPLGTIFATGAIEIEGHAHLVRLPQRVAHTQDYIAASAFALIKGGWSSVAECLVLGVPFGILEQGDTEDEELVNKLFDQKLAFKTTEEELRNFDIKDLNIKTTTVKKAKFRNDADKIAQTIISYMD